MKTFVHTCAKPIRTLLLALCAIALVGLSAGCEDEVVATQPQKATPGGGGGKKKGHKRRRRAAQQETVPWTTLPRNWERRRIEGRDPFYGFVDKIIAERRKQEELAEQQQTVEEQVLLPAQKYDVRDFKLVGVVTNTAQPKALLIDPLGQPHTVKQGDLIGNRNGVLVEIRRDEIEILQGEDIVNNPEYVQMRLHPELPPGLRIELK